MQKPELNSLPDTVAKAKAAGSSKYYTGKPCRHGHDTYRYTNDRACSQCVKLKVKKAATVGGGNARRWANKTQEQLQAIYAKRKDYYEKTRAARIAERKRSYSTLGQSEEWLEKRRNYTRQYRKTPYAAAYRRAEVVRRRTLKLQRFPSWANPDAIAEFYKNCPKGYHVDHVLPLRGDTVSGLHVLENLQYLSAIDNVRKGNKYVPA